MFSPESKGITNTISNYVYYGFIKAKNSIVAGYEITKDKLITMLSSCRKSTEDENSQNIAIQTENVDFESEFKANKIIEKCKTIYPKKKLLSIQSEVNETVNISNPKTSDLHIGNYLTTVAVQTINVRNFMKTETMKAINISILQNNDKPQNFNPIYNFESSKIEGTKTSTLPSKELEELETRPMTNPRIMEIETIDVLNLPRIKMLINPMESIELSRISVPEISKTETNGNMSIPRIDISNKIHEKINSIKLMNSKEMKIENLNTINIEGQKKNFSKAKMIETFAIPNNNEFYNIAGFDKIRDQFKAEDNAKINNSWQKQKDRKSVV